MKLTNVLLFLIQKLKPKALASFHKNLSLHDDLQKLIKISYII